MLPLDFQGDGARGLGCAEYIPSTSEFPPRHSWRGGQGVRLRGMQPKYFGISPSPFMERGPGGEVARNATQVLRKFPLAIHVEGTRERGHAECDESTKTETAKK